MYENAVVRIALVLVIVGCGGGKAELAHERVQLPVGVAADSDPRLAIKGEP